MPVATSRRRRRTPAARRRRALTYLLVVPLAIAALVVIVLDVDHLVPRTGPAAPRPAPAQVVNSVPSPSATHADLRARVVPANAHVDRQGYVMVVCRNAAGDSGTVQFVRPGAVVTCPNATMPRIVAER